MTQEQMPWVIGLLLIALLIVVINDRTKPKKTSNKTEKSTSGSPLGLLIGIVVTVGIIALGSVYGSELPSLKWIVPLVYITIVLLVCLFVLRKLIWLYLKALVTGQFPRVIIRGADGQMQTKCPKCSGKVPVIQGQVGETAIECPHCGEKATWASEIKS